METLDPLSALLLCSVFIPSLIEIKPALHAAVVSAGGFILFALCLLRVHRSGMARQLCLIIAMPIIAWVMPNLHVLYVVMLVWVPLWARRAGHVVPVYLLSLMLLPALDTDLALGALKLFEFGVHDGLAIGAAVAIFLALDKAKPPRLYDHVVTGTVLMIALALSREASLSHMLRTCFAVSLDLALPYYILSRGVRNLDELGRAIRTLASAGAAVGALLIYEAWRVWPVYNALYTQHGVQTLLLVKSRGGWMRSGGPFVEPTSAAMVMAMCIIALWLARDNFRTRAHFWLMFVISVVGLSAPQSRGAWIGLLLALVAADFFRRHYLALVKKSVVLAIAGLGALTVATFSSSVSESLGQSGGSVETSEYRRLLFQRGMEEFRNSPIIGFSPAELKRRLGELQQGEGIIDFVNTYIWIMLIAGGIGLAVFVGCFLYSLASLMRARAVAFESRPGEYSATFIFATTVMLMEMFFFTSFGGRPAFLTFAVFGMTAALTAACRVRPVPEALELRSAAVDGCVRAPKIA